MQNSSPSQTGTSSTGLDANIAALLCYVFGWVSGLIFFLIEKDSKLVRFHAMQSILFNITVIVVAVLLWIVTFIFVLIASQLLDFAGTLFALVATLFWIAYFIVVVIAWILCLVRAYQSQMFKLPIIGNMAAKIVNK